MAEQACRLCAGERFAAVLDLGDQPLAENFDGDGKTYPLRIHQCTGCGLVQLAEPVPQAVVFPPEHPYATGNTKALVEHYGALARLLAGDLRIGDLVIDIGANDGTLLACYPSNLRRVAVEPTNQVRKAPPGVVACQEFFTSRVAHDIVAAHGRAKVVTACNVLAHVPDVHDFISGVRTLLDTDGVFVTENHSFRSVLAGQWDTIYHEHQCYWDAATLSRLLADHGLDTVSVQDIPTHGGSFRTRAVRRDMGALRRVPETAAALHALLAQAHKEGPVYGVGATTRAVPLIHYAGIADFIDVVTEVNTSDKLGRVMPGTGIPVVSDERLIQDQPSYALILAWHLADPIMASLRRRGYKGRFIIPLPTPTVLDA